MTHDEPWQVYHKNGTSLAGVGVRRADFTDDLIMGAAHIWVWRRRSDGMVEVLAQKRAATKMTWPGYYDISAAGHIDAGETATESARREAKEEIGLVVDPDRLLFIFSIRTSIVPNEIDYVYLYEAASDFIPLFDDGEVETAVWFTVGELRERFEDPDAHHFVNQGSGYFALLLTQLERL